MKMLMPNHFYQSCCMYLSPYYKPMVPQFLLSESGLMRFIVEPPNNQQNVIAVFISETSYFGFGIFDGVARIFRNSDKAELVVPKDFEGDVVFHWQLDCLYVMLDGNNSYNQVNEVTTAPYKIEYKYLADVLQVLDKKKSSYKDEEDLMDTILLAVHQIEINVKYFNSFHSFWNYCGTTFTPKQEIHIQPILLEMISKIVNDKGIEISPESQISNGKIDFLFTSKSEDGRDLTVICEFKLAHNKDINNAVTQLNEYLKRRKIDYGILLIGWFKCRYFDKPAKFNPIDLGFLLQEAGKKIGLKNIYIQSLDLAPDVSPSKFIEERKRYSGKL